MPGRPDRRRPRGWLTAPGAGSRLAVVSTQVSRGGLPGGHPPQGLGARVDAERCECMLQVLADRRGRNAKPFADGVIRLAAHRPRQHLDLASRQPISRLRSYGRLHGDRPEVDKVLLEDPENVLLPLVERGTAQPQLHAGDRVGVAVEPDLQDVGQPVRPHDRIVEVETLERATADLGGQAQRPVRWMPSLPAEGILVPERQNRLIGPRRLIPGVALRVSDERPIGSAELEVLGLIGSDEVADRDERRPWDRIFRGSRPERRQETGHTLHIALAQPSHAAKNTPHAVWRQARDRSRLLHMHAGCIAALCLLLIGCGAAAPGESDLTGPAGRTPAPQETVSVTPAPSLPSHSEDASAGAAPTDLAGTWRRSFEGAPLVLTLHETGYSVQAAGGAGAGRIFVEGDRITFSDSNRCEGTGTYTWSIEDERLRFTLMGDDPCARVDFLLRATFGRVEP